MSRPPVSSSTNLFHLAALLILAAAAALCYLPVSDAALLAWDTRTYIIDNHAIHRIDPQSLWWMLTQIYHANWHPLTWLSHALDIQLFGFAPAGHHWINVAWHIACSWMLYALVLRLLPRLRAADLERLRVTAFIAALLFAVHPQHVESVAWVAERKDLLCAFFYLLCLYCYDAYIDRPSLLGFTLVLASATLAMLSKPMAVTLPATLLLFDWLLYRRIRFRFWRATGWVPVLTEKIPLALLAVICILMTLQGQAGSGAVSTVDSITLLQRLATSVINWVEYPLATILPLNLSPFYPVEYEIDWLKLSYSTLILILLLAGAEFGRRRGMTWPMLALGYYTITLLPVIGLIQIGAIRAADRYAYLPTLPLYLLAAVWLMRLLHPPGKTTKTGLRAVSRRLLLLVLPVVLGVETFQYSKVWRSDVSLWEFVQAQKPYSAHATIFLAEAYYAEQRYAEALPHYRRAFEIRWWIAPSRRLNIFINRYSDTAFRLGHYEEAEIALNIGLREQRLWFMQPAQIFLNAALINLKLERFDNVEHLLGMAADSGAAEGKLAALEAELQAARQKQRSSANE